LALESLKARVPRIVRPDEAAEIPDRQNP